MQIQKPKTDTTHLETRIELRKAKMEKLTKYEKEIVKITEAWGNDPLLIFRGQSDASWELNSSAERRIKNSGEKLGMIEYLTKHLIEPARNEGYGNQQNRYLNDLELLAALQHQGAATCLIDFTANFHLALWFACIDPEEDGAVFVIDSGDIRTFREVTTEQANNGIEKLPKGETDTPKFIEGKINTPSSIQSPSFYYWKPPPNENRIVVQNSCFIFSFLLNSISETVYKKITIPKNDKEAIRDLLQKYYGLSMRTVFRDFTGFASSHGRGMRIDIPTAERYYQSGDNRFRRGEYDRAIADYTRGIALKPDLTSAYYNRGLAYHIKGDYDRAIADYDRVIVSKPDLTVTYVSRGPCLLH